jgi:hypothetical protein
MGDTVRSFSMRSQFATASPGAIEISQPAVNEGQPDLDSSDERKSPQEIVVHFAALVRSAASW